MAEPGLKLAIVVLHRFPLDWQTKYNKPGINSFKTEPDTQDLNYTGYSKVHLDADQIKKEADVADNTTLEPPFLVPCSSTEIQCLQSADLNCLKINEQCEDKKDGVSAGKCSQLQGQDFTKTDMNDVNNDNLKLDVMTTQCNISRTVNRADVHTDESPSQPYVKSVAPGDTRKRKKHGCFLCGKVLRSQESLRYHQRIHTGEKPFSCAECGKKFSRSTSLKFHQQIHRGKEYVCRECGKSFYVLSCLKQHQRLHSGKNQYSCAECGRTFSCSSSLTYHRQTHVNKEYICCECGKSFRVFSYFKQHQRLHSPDTPYRCAECGKTFLCLRRLTNHRETHVRKEYDCSDCGKSFHVSYLKQHQRVYSGETQYSCAECRKKFSRLSNSELLELFSAL